MNPRTSPLGPQMRKNFNILRHSLSNLRKDKTAVRVEIRWDDGSMSLAEGEHAAQVMLWYHDCETLAMLHGMGFDGEPMRVIVADTEEKWVMSQGGVGPGERKP